MYCCYSRWFGARDECVGDVGDGLGLFGGWWLGLHKHQMWTVTGKKGEATNSVPMLLLLMMMLMMLVMFWDSLPCEVCLRAGSKSTAAGPQDNEDPVFSSPLFFTFFLHCSSALQHQTSNYLPCLLLRLLQPSPREEWKLELRERILPFLGGANCRRWSSPELQLLPGFGNSPTFSLSLPLSPFKSAPKLNPAQLPDWGGVFTPLKGWAPSFPVPFLFPFLFPFFVLRTLRELLNTSEREREYLSFLQQKTLK